MAAPSVSWRGQGSASCNHIEDVPTRYGHIEIYSAHAYPATGWHFVNWEIERLDGSSQISGDNPLDFMQEYYDTSGPSGQNYSRIVAVFEKDSPGPGPGPGPEPVYYTVTVIVNPQTPNAAKFVSGGGRYLAGSTCTISTLEKCSPWTFKEWTLSPGGTSASKTHSFTVVANTTCTANFKHTDSGNPYDEGGSILCGRSGDILYDGDRID